jgi:hypothetical protein
MSAKVGPAGSIEPTEMAAFGASRSLPASRRRFLDREPVAGTRLGRRELGFMPLIPYWQRAPLRSGRVTSRLRPRFEAEIWKSA